MSLTLESRPTETALSPEETAAMLRAVLRLFALWGVSTTEARILLGQPSERTFQRWRAGEVAGLAHDVVFRLGCLLGIHAALRGLFTDPQRGHAWVRRPNAAFGGASALDAMLQGLPTDLARVRAYLDAERSAW